MITLTVNVTGDLTRRERLAVRDYQAEGETVKQCYERLCLADADRLIASLNASVVDPLEVKITEELGRLDKPGIKSVLDFAKTLPASLLIIACFLIGGSAVSAEDFPLPQRPLLKAFQSTGIVTANGSAGTAWVVRTSDDQRIAITNAHVVGQNHTVQVRFPHIEGCPVTEAKVSYRTRPLRAVPSPGDEDIAILDCRDLPSQATGFRLASLPLSVHRQVYTVGAPHAAGPTMLPIQSFNPSDLSWSPPALGGRSGSPVFYCGDTDPVSLCTLFCTTDRKSFGTSLDPILSRCGTALRETGLKDRISDIKPEINVAPVLSLTFWQLFQVVFLGQVVVALIWPLGKLMMWIVRQATLEAARQIEAVDSRGSPPPRRTRKVVPKSRK